MSPPLVHHQAYGYLLVVLLDRMQISHRPQTHRVTSKTSIVDSLVSIAAAEASFVPGRWERSFRRLGKEEEGSMGL